ncbi:ABC transporter ATP-binding protein [Roseomonas sp. SSH11]|uniref:ABC transporter ATP-binding protein n=1 Tax=Pararoseomonas baculiformis TaxID=2820812 RepID=A0ABS4A886_9PROT|nr:ABC transporter ATP-binding protein [Pararoseomonas baculiformis]MBP0443210.1 ABC transporter ATP-binding protein [Pararoseomonas baculiformis]
MARLVSFSTEGTIFDGAAPRPVRPAALGEPAPAALLAFEAVRKAGYEKGVQALAPFDLQVARGESVALLGPAGAGKSVVIDLVAGFLQPDDGRLLLGGEKLARQAAWRRDIGLVSGAPDLFPDMTVLDNAAFSLEARGVGRAEREDRAAAMLERWGVPPGLGARRPSELSLARQMRVAFARALVHGPAVLLLDDPLRALDGEERDSLAADLGRLRSELGLTVLHATRDAGLAFGLSDRVAVLDGGRVRQLGTPQALYDSPADPVVAALTGPCNRLPGSVVSLDGEACHVRLDCGLEAMGMAVAGPQGGPVAGGRCTLVIRPEQVAVAPLSPEEMGEDAVPARLVEARFAGDHLRLRLALGEGGELVAHRPPGLLLPPIGTEASIAWDLHAARVYQG